MSDFTVIRPYAVPREGRVEFIRKWKVGAEFLRTKDGYIRCELLKSLEPGSEFPYVGIIEWKDWDTLIEVLKDPKLADFKIELGGQPALYKPVRD